MIYYKLILFIVCFVISLQVARSTPLNNKFLKRFAKINYDSLHVKHDRVKRSLDKHLSFSFDAYDKTFKIRVQPSDKNYFATNKIELDGENVELDPVSNYEGKLADQPDTSYVFGSITDGYFIGVISTRAGKYFIEPAKRYSNATDSHSIMYHESDVNLSARLGDAKKQINKILKNSNADAYYQDAESDSDSSSSSSLCGLSDNKVKEKLDLEQDSARKAHSNEDLLYKYSREANQHRMKRQTGALSFPNDKSVCSLYLIADPFFYNQIFTSEGQNNAKMTLAYIQSYFNSYVAALNSVFNPLKFFTDSSQQSYYTGVQFKIFKTKVITFDQCTSPTSTLSDAEKKLCDSNLDTMTYLSNVALQNYNSYCLAYAFTARDFSNGALGLAYLASSNGAAGGLCQKNTDINGVKKSLNSGMVTLINYGSRVVDLITQIAFLHEVGHSFGAQHDPASCQPGDASGGNYIMYFSSSSGTKPNNKLFSSCSLSTMGPILNFVVKNNFCFEASTTNICGNGIVEANEGCDCGFPDQCQDSCCNSTTCQLVSGAQCSPSQGLCCESDCKYSQATKQCSAASDCSSNAFCTGNSASCSAVGSNSDLTACNGGTQVCLGGKCIGSICQRYNLTQCFLSGDLTDATVDKFKLCHLACTGADTNNICTDTFNITKIVRDLSTGIVMKPGSVCDNNLGYCDALSKCRQANHDSVLNKLIVSLLNPSKTLNDIKQWVIRYWWAVLIFVIIFLVAFMLVIYILSKLLPSSNPSIKARDEVKKKEKLEVASRVRGGRGGVESRRRSQIFTTEISDNVDYERTVPKQAKSAKQRILV